MPKDGAAGELERRFTTEVGTFQVQLFGGEGLDLTMRCRDLDWSQSYKVTSSDHAKMISVNTRELSRWLTEAEAQKTALKERGLLPFEVEVVVTYQNRMRFRKRFPFVVDFATPPSPDPHRYAGDLDRLSRTPEVGAIDETISGQDPRLYAGAARHYRQDESFDAGTFGIGMRDSGAVHLGFSTWFEPADLPETYTATTELKGRQREIVGQPGEAYEKGFEKLWEGSNMINRKGEFKGTYDPIVEVKGVGYVYRLNSKGILVMERTDKAQVVFKFCNKRSNYYLLTGYPVDMTKDLTP